MWQRLYGVYDRKANDLVGPLMLFPSDGAAVRSLEDILVGGKSILTAHPDDYVLRCYAKFGREEFEDAPCVEELSPSDVVEIALVISTLQRSQPVVQADASEGSSVLSLSEG